MTDEERAREIAVKCVGIISDKERIAVYALEAFAAIRAEVREKCAQVVESEAGDEEPSADIDIGYDMAIVHAAAAIRAMGDKGNG